MGGKGRELEARDRSCAGTRVTFFRELGPALAAAWDGLGSALLTQALTITAFWDGWEKKKLP